MKKLAGLLLLTLIGARQELDLAALEKWPSDLKGATVADGKATLTHDKWGCLVTPGDHADAEIEATVTIQEPAKQFTFFGQHWSVWPDLTYSDQGFEAAILARAGKESGYRIQLCHSLQQVALVKYPDGGYLRVVPCELKLKTPLTIAVALRGGALSVRVNGQEKIAYRDTLLPLSKGRLGIGASSGAKVVFEKVAVKPLAAAPAEAPAPHVPSLSVRTWLGGWPWVFDGDEPIMMLVTAAQPYINNVKLRPGFKPLLSWNSFWDTACQGAFPDGAVKVGDATVTGGGKTLTATWGATGTKGRFVQRLKMVVGWDEKRSVYTYDCEGELEVLAGDPFHFRYGYDFEHHTPLDPFRWQYLIVRREGGQVVHRPVYPVDPGGMDLVEQSGGARVWYGRHGQQMVIAPAVEYDLPDAGKRKMNTAVCAAFYDTGVALASETAPAGTKVRVKFRYTGWPAAEADALWKASKIYDTPTLDPQHHYIFAEWPKLTFTEFVPMSETWIYGRRPYMTGHNLRPTYALEKNAGAGSGFAMKLGPGAYGAADLPIPGPLPEGKYAVTAMCKAANLHGPGGRIELAAKDKNGKVLKQEHHYVGNGSWEWKKIGFTSSVPGGATAFSVGFGNAGSGDVWFTDVEFKKIEGDAPPLAAANGAVPKFDRAPAGALFDYRMVEQKGLHVYDFAGGPFGFLELANADWTVDEGRPALKFANPPAGRHDTVRLGGIERNYLRTIQWTGTPVAIAGMHGGGVDIKAFTFSSWIKPAASMGPGAHGNSGDIAGIGARRFILRLMGRQAPYPLQAAFDVNDRFQSTATVEADRWSHVAMTAETTETKKWRVRVYLNGRKVVEGVTEKLNAPGSVAPSLILASELFYLHDSYYRGLIGRTMLLDRALGESEISELAR